MFRPLEIFIGLRYTRAKRRNHFISFISLVSILGIAVGVTALITVISVMNGFDKELKDRILGMVAHATISGVDESVHDWKNAVDLADRNPDVIGAAPYVEREAFLQGERNAGAILRGVLPDYEPKVSEIGARMVAGKLDDLKPGGFGIILGRELAATLGVREGDSVTVFAAEFSATPIGAVPRLKRFTVVGMFDAGMQEYDAGLAVIHMSDAETLYRLDGPSGIRLKLNDMFRAYSVGQSISSELGQMYRVSDWMQGHSNFFKAIAMEKKVMFLILSLIVAVAAFNLVSTLVML
ncbi:MAG: ABC transporter permease, partial [Dokdonella sp.]